MSFELGGFAEDETVIDGDFNAFNYCLAYDYLCAFENEDFDALGEVNNDLIDTITDWLNYDGEIGKNNIDKIKGIDNGTIMTCNNRTFLQCIIDEHQVDMAETYILRGVKNPELYLTCILYGDDDSFKSILNAIHYFINSRYEYMAFLKRIFNGLDEEYKKISSSEDKYEFLNKIKVIINNIRYPQDYGKIKFSKDDYEFGRQLVKVNEKSSKN